MPGPNANVFASQWNIGKRLNWENVDVVCGSPATSVTRLRSSQHGKGVLNTTPPYVGFMYFEVPEA